MSTSRSDKSSGYHHGDLRAALVAAGIELLERNGVDGLTLRAAARLVGVSHAAPARHFPDTESFVAEIATVGYRRLVKTLDDARRGRQPLDGFQHMGRAYVGFALAHPHWYRAIFHPSLADKEAHPDLLAASTEAFERLRAGVAASIDAGAVRRDDVSVLALSVWSTVHGLAVLLIDDQLRTKGYRASTDDLIESVLTTLFLGLAVPPA